MLTKINTWLGKDKDERGGSELVATVLLIPIATFLIFALINFGFYNITRSSVQQVVRDGVRTVALYGGNSANTALNQTGKPVAQLIKDRLYANGRCLQANCLKPPVVSCTPEKAKKVGTTVSCTLSYTYQPVVLDPFGFSKITQETFTFTESSVSETGYN